MDYSLYDQLSRNETGLLARVSCSSHEKQNWVDPYQMSTFTTSLVKLGYYITLNIKIHLGKDDIYSNPTSDRPTNCLANSNHLQPDGIK